MKYLGSSIAAATIALLGTAAVTAATGDGRMKADADGNGVLTQPEAMAAADARFARMDANNDGRIDPSDRLARAKARFAKMDVDGDGSVTEAEFLAARDARMEKRAKRKSASREGRRGGKMRKRGGRMGKIMQRADADNDGAVSQAEFRAAAQARFTRADANNDGQVTREERRAQRKMRRNMRGK